MLRSGWRRVGGSILVLLLSAAGLTACKDDDTVADPDQNPIFHLGPEADQGVTVCGRNSTTASGDGWAYTLRSSRASGLVLGNLRLGPRLMARQISVPYLRVTTADTTTHTAYLTPDGVRQPDLTVTSRLAGAASCGTDDSDVVVSATYQVAIHPVTLGSDVTLLVEQQYRFSDDLDHACEASHTAVCKRFWPTIRWQVPDPQEAHGVSVSVVQRFDLDPDDGVAQGSSGGADLVRDAIVWHNDKGHFGTGVDDLAGEQGHLRSADSRMVLKDGAVPDNGWENYHQTSRHVIGLPAALNAGCTECVHTHWSWFDDPHLLPTIIPIPDAIKKLSPISTAGERRAIANSVACGGPSCWSDGKPEIRPGSRQTACIGWTTSPPTTTVDWCHLDAALKQPLGATPPVMYWNVTSDADTLTMVDGQQVHGDGYWDKLAKDGDHYSHGGNGSFFFVPARRLAASVEQAAQLYFEGQTSRPVVATASALWPARQDTTGFQNGRWILPVRIVLGDKSDQGPYYVRVKTTGVQLVNPDGRYDPGFGGAPWVTVQNDTADTGGSWRLGPGRHVVSRYSDVADSGGLVTLLAFDRQPQPGQVAIEVDAAPDGTGTYSPSDGTVTNDPLPATQTGSRLSNVNWVAVAGPGLRCSSDPETVFDPVEHDVTGDGVADVFVPLDCYTGDDRYPSTIEVFDGASEPTAPTRIGQFTDIGYVNRGGCLTFTGSSLQIRAREYRDSDPAGAPSLLMTTEETWTGSAFTRTARTVTDVSPDAIHVPGCN